MARSNNIAPFKP